MRGRVIGVEVAEWTMASVKTMKRRYKERRRKAQSAARENGCTQRRGRV